LVDVYVYVYTAVRPKRSNKKLLLVLPNPALESNSKGSAYTTKLTPYAQLSSLPAGHASDLEVTRALAASVA
jgi:hypothetical protein